MTIIDSINKPITLPSLPKRIISLVPSLTELLFFLTDKENIVGVTKFCINPKEALDIVKIGGTKNINLEKIKSLNPDLIIVSKEENVKEQVEALHSFVPVYTTDISSIDEALTEILKIGTLIGKLEKAKQLSQDIRISFENKRFSNLGSVVYLIWESPIMTIGGDTYINDVLDRIGFSNLFKNENRYPIISEELLISLKPKYIFLSTEPYPFKPVHVEEYSLKFPDSKVMLVDGESFSWYGSKLLKSIDYFVELTDNLKSNY